MYTIIYKNTFLPNIPDKHENNARQAKNGNLRKEGVSKVGKMVTWSSLPFHVYRIINSHVFKIITLKYFQ